MSFMSQTNALLIDGYRQLRHRKLFWIALALSLLVVIAVGATGVNERGWTILHWTIEGEINSKWMKPSSYYKWLFVALGVEFWLTWIATILALVTTAGIIPDLVSSGSIDLMVSKPISRARLFLTKFAGGLLFAALQVGIFSVASFFILGLRAGAWEPKIFLAIPLVIVFFSYLFAICALIGLFTRSTVASLLLTILAWALISGVWGTSEVLNLVRIRYAVDVHELERRIPVTEDAKRLETYKADLEKFRASQGTYELVCRIGTLVVTPMPKPGATIELLQRSLIDIGDLPKRRDNDRNPLVDPQYAKDEEMTSAAKQWKATQTPLWIIGTSLASEAVILLVCCWIFSRRDY